MRDRLSAPTNEGHGAGVNGRFRSAAIGRPGPAHHGQLLSLSESSRGQARTAPRIFLAPFDASVFRSLEHLHDKEVVWALRHHRPALWPAPSLRWTTTTFPAMC